MIMKLIKGLQREYEKIPLDYKNKKTIYLFDVIPLFTTECHVYPKPCEHSAGRMMISNAFVLPESDDERQLLNIAMKNCSKIDLTVIKEEIEINLIGAIVVCVYDNGEYELTVDQID